MQKLYFLFILWVNCLFGQNLVPNAGFENLTNYNEPVHSENNFKLCKNWYTSITGSPDLLHPKMRELIDHKARNFDARLLVPYKAKSGNGLAAIYTFTSYDYKEFIQVELDSALSKGKEYYIVLYAKPDSKITNIYGADLEILLSSQNVDDFNISAQKPQITYSISEKDTCCWMKIESKYIAKGGEKFLTIGNFRSSNNRSKQIKMATNDKSTKYEYILIDDIYIGPKIDFNSITRGRSIQLHEILFDTDQTTIKQESFGILEQLCQFLKENDSLAIQINGHTDNSGDSKKNLLLSQKRAESIKSYLVKAGIKSHRIKTDGFGDKLPIADNKTEEGKALNRRVELKLLSK